MALSSRELPRPGPEMAAVWSRRLEGRSPREILAWSFAQFGDGLAVGSSFGKDGIVLLSMLREVAPHVPVLFLETGYHFPETLELRDRLVRQWSLLVVNVRPELPTDAMSPPGAVPLYRADPDLCCRLRKTEPLLKALQGYRAWIAGLRRDQHPGRAAVPVVDWQEVGPGQGVFKVHPLAGWGRLEVEGYLEEHDLPRHPLWDQGYPSVGCAPCTRAVRPGEPERSGRWAGTGKVECGVNTTGVQSLGAGALPLAAPSRPWPTRLA